MHPPICSPPDRTSLRAHPLDGAMLFFQPATGLHVRVGSAATAGLRRIAPRVVAFGITNRCNLRCSFCSRDAHAPSRWTRATAYEVLRDLEAEGVLEVAFGGGEPFVFPDFLGLLGDLHAGTRLALNITTNGTRIDGPTARALAGMVGMVRLSIYPDTNWRAAAVHLTQAGVRWGANVLVHSATLPTLPALLHELRGQGCEDASILRYVGSDLANQLDQAGLRRLDEVLAESPVATRVSVCFGPQLHAPLLFSGADGRGDCGAGRDFLTVTADGAVQACSFQEAGFAARTGADILRVWREQGDALSAPSPRRGCARGERLAPRAAEDLSGVRVWRTFSGNNSGECLMVARFAAVEDAERYLADLLPGYLPEAAFPQEWRRLLDAEGVYSGAAETPQELVAVGRSVFALGYGADDLFLPLRALAQKRGAEVEPGGVHLHGGLTVVFAIRANDGPDADAILSAVRSSNATARRHDEMVFGFGAGGALSSLDPTQRAGGVSSDAAMLARLSAGRSSALTILHHEVDDAALQRALQRLDDRQDNHRRMFIRFPGSPPESGESAAWFAAGLKGPAVQVGGALLVEPPFGKRLAVEASGRGAHVELLTARTCHVNLWLDPPDTQPHRRPSRLDGGELAAELVEVLGLEGHAREIREIGTRIHLDGGAWLSVDSDDPGAVLRAGATVAERHGLLLRPDVTDVGPLGMALRRLVDEVTESPPER